MHRTLPRATSPYRVVFTSQAWKEVGLMPTALFDAFQRAVDDLAAKYGKLNAPVAEQSARQHLSVATLVVTYERDDAARTLMLVEIRRTPESP
jgi:hypothetical protein